MSKKKEISWKEINATRFGIGDIFNPKLKNFNEYISKFTNDDSKEIKATENTKVKGWDCESENEVNIIGMEYDSYTDTLYIDFTTDDEE